MNSSAFTNDDLLSFLQDELQEGDTMKGTIRPSARHLICEECGEKFIFIHHKIGYRCSCKRSPAKYVIDIAHQGKRPRIYVDKSGQILDTWARARAMQAIITAEIENRTFDPSTYIKAEISRYFAAALLEVYKADKLPHLSPSYTADFKRYCKYASEHFRNMDVREIRKVHLNEYRRHLETQYQSHSPKTRKNIMDAFKAFLNWCRDEEYISSVPAFPEIELASPAPPQWLAQDAQIKALELFHEEDRPIIAFLFLHGCRPSEARALRCKHVDLRTNTITITATFSKYEYREKRKGKRSKPATIPIHPELLDFIANRVKNNLPEAFVFVNPRTGNHYGRNTIQNFWSSFREKLGLPTSFRFYDASRHSAGSQMAAAGVPIYTISKLLGHSSVKMTERFYVHPELENMRTSMATLTLKKPAAIVEIKSA